MIVHDLFAISVGIAVGAIGVAAVFVREWLAKRKRRDSKRTK